MFKKAIGAKPPNSRMLSLVNIYANAMRITLGHGAGPVHLQNHSQMKIGKRMP